MEISAALDADLGLVATTESDLAFWFFGRTGSLSSPFGALSMSLFSLVSLRIGQNDDS